MSHTLIEAATRPTADTRMKVELTSAVDFDFQQKVLRALSTTTARTPMDTEQVRSAVGTPLGVFTMLERLRDQQKVGHCRSIRRGVGIDYWWLAGNCLADEHGHSYRRKKK